MALLLQQLNQEQNIVIRIMYKAGKMTVSYYRVVIGAGPKYTKEALTSEIAHETHIPISLHSLSEIIKIITKIWSEEWNK